MRKCLLALLLGITLQPVFSQTVHNGVLSASDGFFNRPDEGMPPTVLSLTQTHVYYDTIQINVEVPSLITFSSSSVWDNFIILYSPAGFDPLAPLQNALLANDDFSGPNSGFTYSFSTAGVYTLVICSYKNDVTGGYSVTSSAPIPLPLKLLSFTANKSGKNNLVKWTTADESNLSSYQVQLSVNNTDFDDLKSGNIIAKNNYTSTSYSFTHDNPAAGYNYYRLKITERSGHIAYTPVAVVKNTKFGLAELHLYPNPTSSFVKIEAKGLQSSKAAISVINSAGQIMQSGQYNFSQGILSVNIKNLPAGKYFLTTSVGDEQTMLSFIKN